MKIVEAFADYSQFLDIRRDIHAHPELGFDEHRTSEIVATKLSEWGIEVHRGIAGTGVVGVLKAGSGPRTIGLRADMDCLPLQELNQFAHASTHPGQMHACGHDGHTTMLLAAAWHLSQTRNFNGTVNFVFQPAEEMGRAGAKKMIADGLFERFPCDAIFGLHNFSIGNVGGFALNDGAFMASSNLFKITIKGRGTHASMPHTGIDPVAPVLALATALQGVVSKVVPTTDRALLAVTQLQGSVAPNIIPDEASLGGVVRTFSLSALDRIEQRVRTLATHIAQSYECEADISFRRASPPVINHPNEARFAAEVMREVVGKEMVDDQFPGVLTAEDFAYMLLERPGCYAFMGNGEGKHRLEGHGEGACILHNASYDFNDAIIPVGASYFVRLTEKWLNQD